VARHPEIPAAGGIESLVEVFHPFSIRLPADADALDVLIALRREVYVERHALRQPPLQDLARDLCNVRFNMRKVGFVRIVAKRKSDRRSSFDGAFDGSRHSAGIQHTDGGVTAVIDAAYDDVRLTRFMQEHKMPRDLH